MPTSIVATLVGSVIADWAAAELALAGFSVFIGEFNVLRAAVAFAVSSGLNAALRGGGKAEAPQLSYSAQTRTHMVRSPVATRTLVYGENVVSGPLVWAATDDARSTLYMVIALAGHEVEAIDTIYFNDTDVGALATRAVAAVPAVPETWATWVDAIMLTPYIPGTPEVARVRIGQITGGTYVNAGTIRKYLGSDTQQADADLVATGLGWTKAHRLQGVAYIAVELYYSREKYPTGIPNVKVKLRGKKVYDPRTGSTAYSTNPALCILDYLRSPLGLGCDDDEVDEDSFIAAANICDESVALAGGGSEARYTCHGVVDLAATPKAILQQMLASCAGLLSDSATGYRLRVGAYEAPVATLTADDLAGAANIRARVPRSRLYNGVRGVFVDPAQSYQPVDFVPQSSAAYAAQDGAEIWRDIELSYTQSQATAQRLARLILEKSRQGITVELPLKPRHVGLEVGRTVAVTLTDLGWTDKEFVVTDWRWAGSSGLVTVTLQEEAAACYAWSSADEAQPDPAPDTSLPDPFTVAAPGRPSVREVLYLTTGSAGVKSRAEVTLTPAADGLAVEYVLQYCRTDAEPWRTVPLGGGTYAAVDDIYPGEYRFRAAAKNALGVSSPWSDETAVTLAGLTATPSDVAGFAVLKSAGFALARWDLAPDLDVRIGGRIGIRHSPLTAGANWEDGVSLISEAGGLVSALVPLITGTYLAKFEDSSGNWSATAASFVVTEAMVTAWTTAGSLTEEPGFTGSKTNCGVSGGVLSLTDLTVGAAEYQCHTHIDCATQAVRRWDVKVTAAYVDSGDTIDARGAVDDWDSVDGGVINDCTVQPYIRTTNDNPAGSPTWTAWVPWWVADWDCRAAEVKLALTNGSPTHDIRITGLTVRARDPV